jgi:hypothetical protein
VQLGVLDQVGFVKRRRERKHAGGECARENRRREPQREPELQRLRHFFFETIHSTPLTFLSDWRRASRATHESGSRRRDLPVRFATVSQDGCLRLRHILAASSRGKPRLQMR